VEFVRLSGPSATVVARHVTALPALLLLLPMRPPRKGENLSHRHGVATSAERVRNTIE
jgi:hypothetical protein